MPRRHALRGGWRLQGPEVELLSWFARPGLLRGRMCERKQLVFYRGPAPSRDFCELHGVREYHDANSLSLLLSGGDKKRVRVTRLQRDLAFSQAGLVPGTFLLQQAAIVGKGRII
eukprot:1149495-Pelagomonas_calceolata.AAC.17